MADLTAIAPRLDPLIRRLGTNHDGERLATDAALERTLATAKADFHDSLEVRRVENAGNVRAYLSLRVGGVTIHGAKIVQQRNQKPWLAMPDRQWTAADGKVRYTAVVELTPSLKQRVNDAVLAGWETTR
jgi:DNA-binding cell septation regulator SpoVG